MRKLKLSIPSNLNSIINVENFGENLISEFQLQEELRGRITLSIVEAVTNAILYGNKQNPLKKVKLSAAKTTKKVTVTIEDEGEGFNFKNIPDPTSPPRCMQAARKGLYLMLKLTDKLEFTKHGAKVTMSFSLNS